MRPVRDTLFSWMRPPVRGHMIYLHRYLPVRPRFKRHMRKRFEKQLLPKYIISSEGKRIYSLHLIPRRMYVLGHKQRHILASILKMNPLFAYRLYIEINFLRAFNRTGSNEIIWNTYARYGSVSITKLNLYPMEDRIKNCTSKSSPRALLPFFLPNDWCDG